MAEDKKTQELLSIAKEQFKRVVAAEGENRQYMLDDLRFRAASPDNKYQWPDSIRMKRETDGAGQRPCLTINKIPQHVNQVTNDIRQNRPSIKVIPVDDEADPEVAEVLNGIIRHIQYSSDADVAYDTAADNEVTAGVGYIRVLTDYIDDKSFDQDILIKRIKNPFTVYMDPAMTEPDGSDARFCFITEMISKEEFEAEYPNAEVTDWETQGRGDDHENWFEDKKVRVAEWWRVEEETKTLSLWANGQMSYDGDDLMAIGVIEGERPIKTRQVQKRVVKFRKITACEILEESDWAGYYIPIARAVGNEFDIEGKMIVSGIVRNAKDAQRMYNYWASQEVEMLALAPKAPFIGAAGQFEGFETEWGTANTTNYAYLEYNPVVDTAAGETPFPPPQRSAPPQPSAGIIQAKIGAADDIKSATGQYDASLGQRSNETSGKAIMARQREGDIGTFHYVDNLSRAIRHVGRIIVDLIPKIYDTKRIARIIGEDDEIDTATIDPNQPQAMTEKRDESGKVIEKIYNPGVGRYDVAVIVGPSYTTKRQEAAEAMTSMVQGNPQLWQVIGDLLVKNMDWPGADEMAKRLKATLLPAVQGEDDEVPPHVKQAINEAMQHMEQMKGQIQQLSEENSQLKQENTMEALKLMIDMYAKRTDRLKALTPLSPENDKLLEDQATGEALSQPGPEA